MGLFKKFRRRLKRKVAKLSRKIETAVKQAAPLLALIPGPVGAAAKLFALARSVAGKDDVDVLSLEPSERPIPLAGFAAQQTRATVGPQARARCFPSQERLPARSAFPVSGSTLGSGFSAPFRARHFPPFAGSTARSPLKFGAQTFPRRAFVGSALPQLRGRAFGQSPLSVQVAFGGV